MTVTADGNKLTGAFNGLSFDLEHWHFDTFIAKDRKGVRPGILLTFVLCFETNVVEVRLHFASEIQLPKTK
jgi:hypothetical protein